MLIPAISPTVDTALSDQLDRAINNKTKPLGSLGALERLAKQIGLIQNTRNVPRLRDPAILVFAGDHGVVAEGVSAFPQDVTWQMVENFLSGGAAINVFARQNGCALQRVDAGVNHDFGPREGLVDRKIAHGTRNFAQEPAMAAPDARRRMAPAWRWRIGQRGRLRRNGHRQYHVRGALMHKLTGIPVAQCVGAGTGLDAEGVLHKQRVIEAASGAPWLDHRP